MKRKKLFSCNHERLVPMIGSVVRQIYYCPSCKKIIDKDGEEY
jgi:hypothetical protein